MFESLAIWYLRKKKKSVLIGYELEDGTVKALNNKAYIYDNRIKDINYYCSDNTPFEIPEGKFNESFQSHYEHQRTYIIVGPLLCRLNALVLFVCSILLIGVGGCLSWCKRGVWGNGRYFAVATTPSL